MVDRKMVLRLFCSCGWRKYQEGNDSNGRMLEILKGVHEMAFKGHECKIEDE